MKSAAQHPREIERIAELDLYDVLDSEDELAFDELTEIASAICGTSISLISLVDRDRQWFKSKVGLAASETPRSIAFCSHAILQDDVFEVPNALEDNRFFDNPLVTGAPDIRFYAGAPLVTSSGLPLGTLCVIDTVPKKLTAVQEKALKVLAHQVVGQLELRLHNHRLERMNANREKIFSVIAHDLRGPFNAILGYSRALSTKANSLKPETIAEMARSILISSLQFYQLLDELLQWSQQQLGAYRAHVTLCSIRELVDADLTLLTDALQIKQLVIDNQVPANLQAYADATLTKTVLRNLIANAIKYSSNGHRISISAEQVEGEVQVSVIDQGAGVPESLRASLFRAPVESQLGTLGEEGHGIGLRLCFDFMHMQHGRIWLDESYSAGTKISFSLPVDAPVP